jgi:hypothetical protein
MGSLQFPWDITPAPIVIPPDDPDAPDWLYHHLTISGPAETVASFAAAARGSGITPWQLDFAAIEEDIFVRAVPSLARSVAQPAYREKHLSVAGCRILARQFRERVELRQARAAALVGHSFVCPFDLHALLPVPTAILQLGPSDPTSLAWLATHWGMTHRLRQVVVRPKATTGRRLRKTDAVIGYGFFTDGETPHAAITRLTERWPGLRFRLMPRPAD